MLQLRKYWIIILCIIPLVADGQGLQGRYWFMGNQVGVDFLPEPPQFVPGNTFTTFEGLATISDSLGNLLFYTNGSVIFNTNHDTLLNGENMPLASGSNNGRNQAAIVKQPGNSNIYYTFFVGDTALGLSASTCFYYTVVDMNLDGGLGGVVTTQKNVLVRDSVATKLAIAKHANNHDSWIITHNISDNSVYSYSLTPNGFSSNPIVSNVGYSYLSDVFDGGMKSSPNSEIISILKCDCNNANPIQNMRLELYKLDRNLGTLSDSIVINLFSPLHQIFNIAFSPDSRKMYVPYMYNHVSVTIPDTQHVVQYDLSNWNITSILASADTVVSKVSPFFNPTILDLQLAIDGKIYYSDANDLFFLNSIECPNQSGSFCMPKDSAVDMNGLWAEMLPTLNQTLFVNADSFQVQMNRDTLCLGDTAQLQAYGSGADQFLWTLPDGTAAPHLSNDTIANPLCFSDTTITYRVVGIARNCTVDRFDTNFITVPVIAPSPSQAQIELLNGSLPLCFGDTATLIFSASSTNATWLSPTSASDTLFIATADTVILEGTARCSTPVYDTVIVDTAGTTMLSTSTDTTICQGDTITISVSGSNQAQWQSNAFLSDTTLANPLAFPPVDTIFVATTSLPCTQNDTVRVNVNPNEQIELSPDSILLCKDTSLTISATTNFQNLEWFPPQWVENSSNSTTRVLQGVEGWLTLNTSNRNCSTSDSVFVNTINPVEARASAEVLLTCEGYTVQTENTSIGASNYSWRLNGMEMSTGVETEILNYNGQVITLLANNRECVDSTQLFISLDSAISSEVQPINVFTPNGDGVNDYFELRGEQFIHCSDLKVFTRWGQQVYDSNGMPPRWDGLTFGGEELPTGYYFYILTVNNKTFTGSVWLRR